MPKCIQPFNPSTEQVLLESPPPTPCATAHPKMGQQEASEQSPKKPESPRAPGCSLSSQGDFLGCCFLPPGYGVTPGTFLLSFLTALCVLGTLGEIQGALGSGKAIPKHRQGGGSCLSHPWPHRGCPKAQERLQDTRSASGMEQCQLQGPAGGGLGSRMCQRSPQECPPAKPGHPLPPGQPLARVRGGCRGQRTSPASSAAQGGTAQAAPACHPHCARHKGQAQGRGRSQHSHGHNLIPTRGLLLLPNTPRQP